MSRLAALAFLLLAGCASAPPSVTTAGSVTKVLCAKAYDPKKNLVSGETWTFLDQDELIVLAVALQDYPAGSRCEIVRYLNGKYLDHGSVAVRKPAASTVFFTWSLKPGARRLPGPYLVKVFVNGRYTRQVAYSIGPT